jgi:hypothetical protein
VDWKGKRFTITVQGQNFNYEFEDIENAELNLGIYYKNHWTIEGVGLLRGQTTDISN